MALVNRVKERLKAGKPAIGVSITAPSPALVEMCAYAGFHYVRIDCEHGPMDPMTVEHMVRAAEATGTTPFARPPVNESHDILRLLDVGVLGLLVPHISSPADAEKAARAMRFYPRGERSSGGPRCTGYGTAGRLSDLVGELNETVFMIALIESAAGVDSIDDILAVDGVDAVSVGPNDLAQSLGVPGQKDHPLVQEHINRVIDRTLAAGKYVSMTARDSDSVDHAKRLLDRGVQLVQFQSTRLFMDAARGVMRSLPL